VPFRGRGFVVVHYRAASWAAFVLLILLWEIAVRQRWISPLFLPAPSSVVEALWDLAVTGTLWLHLKASLMRLAVGWALGTTVGILFGFSIALWSL
jgi:ABC-type nitrate/sulfonate/bicarbonate transport system permease component